MEYQPRFFRAPDQSFFLFGPRGTGKSSWIRHTLPEALVVDLLKPDVFREMSARPERLAQLVLANRGRAPIVIDEVQRVPELLNVVHDLIESHSGLSFVLTGSSARKLRRGGVDLLAGRAVYRTLHPFMAAELTGFELDSALVDGLLPVVVAAPRPADVADAYATLYLEEEVRLEGWTRKIGDFARFLEAVSFSHAAVLNVSNVARECQIERKTVAGYIEILEDLLLSFRLPVFTRRAQRQTSAHPKFYLFDAGVYRSLRPKGPLDRAEEIDGCAFEGLVAQHLRAWIAYSGSDCELFYWRTRAGVEVDFVVYGKDGFWAVEVKNTCGREVAGSPGSEDPFGTTTPSASRSSSTAVQERVLVDGVLCVPGDEFLRSLRPDRGLRALD